MVGVGLLRHAEFEIRKDTGFDQFGIVTFVEIICSPEYKLVKERIDNQQDGDVEIELSGSRLKGAHDMGWATGYIIDRQFQTATNQAHAFSQSIKLLIPLILGLGDETLQSDVFLKLLVFYNG